LKGSKLDTRDAEGKREPCSYEEQVVDTLMKTSYKACGVDFPNRKEVWNLL
jgi:hypothetical protein